MIPALMALCPFEGVIRTTSQEGMVKICKINLKLLLGVSPIGSIVYNGTDPCIFLRLEFIFECLLIKTEKEK